MSKKNILIIGPLPPPLGGVAVMNQSVQKIMQEKYNVISLNTSKNVRNVDIYKIDLFRSIRHGLLNFFNLLIILIKYQVNLANIFVTSNLGFVRDAVLILLLKTFKKKIIIHFHSKKQGEYFLSDEKLFLLKWIMNLSNCIIFLSENHSSYFLNKIKIKTRYTILENFVDYRNFNCQVEDKVFEFLYVGRLSKKKGFKTLLNSLILCKKNNIAIKVHIVGLYENDDFENECKSLIMNNKLNDYLIFHGYKDGEEKFELFKKLLVFVFPSEFENSPLVLKEAIASKMIIIASNIEANVLIGNSLKSFIFFENKNAISLYNAIKKIKCEKNILMNNLKNFSNIKKYDLDIAKNKLFEIHKSLIE